jgi:hypothetical protein
MISVSRRTAAADDDRVTPQHVSSSATPVA